MNIQNNLVSQLPVWNTVRLGRRKSYAIAFKDHAKHDLSSCDYEIARKIVPSESEIDVDLVIVTPEQLGLKKECLLRTAFSRGVKAGLELCTSEVAPATRLARIKMERGADLRFATEPLEVWPGEHIGFHLIGGKNSRSRLLATSRHSKNSCRPDEKIIFVKPRR